MDRFVVKRKRTDADVGSSRQPGPSWGQDHGSTLVSTYKLTWMSCGMIRLIGEEFNNTPIILGNKVR
jgi:hypothetical protein